jgi:hypothetical protein
MTYHLREIKKGTYGFPSKITEEHDEFVEALEQGNPIMALVELSDLVGAIEGYINVTFGVSLDELIKMKDATKRAFKSGHRM